MEPIEAPLDTSPRPQVLCGIDNDNEGLNANPYPGEVLPRLKEQEGHVESDLNATGIVESNAKGLIDSEEPAPIERDVLEREIETHTSKEPIETPSQAVSSVASDSDEADSKKRSRCGRVIQAPNVYIPSETGRSGRKIKRPKFADEAVETASPYDKKQGAPKQPVKGKSSGKQRYKKGSESSQSDYDGNLFASASEKLARLSRNDGAVKKGKNWVPTVWDLDDDESSSESGPSTGNESHEDMKRRLQQLQEQNEALLRILGQNAAVADPSLIGKLKNLAVSGSGAKSSASKSVKAEKVEDFSAGINDLRLIHAMQQFYEVNLVAKLVKFEKNWPGEEIIERWNSVNKSTETAELAYNNIVNLPLEIIKKIGDEQYFLPSEENCLQNTPSGEAKYDISFFKSLLSSQHDVFLTRRTPSDLLKKWNSLNKQGRVREIGKPLPLQPEQEILKELEMQARYNMQKNQSIFDNSSCMKIAIENGIQNSILRMEKLRNNLPRLKGLLDLMTGLQLSQFEPDFTGHELAILRGKSAKYRIHTPQVVFGRSAGQYSPHIDFKLEGSCEMISRRQGRIIMDSTGKFFLLNEGRTMVEVNQKRIPAGYESPLLNFSVIDIAGLRFVFYINVERVADMFREYIHQNTAELLNIKDQWDEMKLCADRQKIEQRQALEEEKFNSSSSNGHIEQGFSNDSFVSDL